MWQFQPVPASGILIVSAALLHSTTLAQTVSEPEPSSVALSERQRCLANALETAYADETAATLRDKCEANEPIPTTTSGIPLPEKVTAPPIERRFASEVGLLVDRLGFMPHRPNYLLPWAYGEGFNTVDTSSTRSEIMFQLSLKLPFTIRSLTDNPDTPVIFFGYTGQAWWQAYNSDRSSPFREYNHSPEVFITLPIRWRLLNWTAKAADLGFEHHSNGRASGSSRSWNRVFAKLDLEHKDDYWLSWRSWWRIPESEKLAPTQAEGDDNPDISRYYGHHELRFGYSSSGWNWNLMLRRSLRSNGKGAAELNLSYPTGFNPRTRWYVRLFDGYGESLIDYNRRVRRIGIGFMLNDWY
ncbi:MAG: phospholipase A [Burkholderiaceae bacterium]